MSPRPLKPRHCRCPYADIAFKPTKIPMDKLEKIPLRRDELEAIRLCDLIGLSQLEAGMKMRISRGTVQRLLESARYKVAKALTEKCALVMKGEET